jgi:hypothetical protein
MPTPASTISMIASLPSARRTTAIRSPGCVAFRAFSTSASSAASSRSASPSGDEDLQAPVAPGGRAPAPHGPLDEGRELDGRAEAAVHVLGGGEQQQAVRDPRQAVELGDDDVGVLDALDVDRLSPQQLDVPAGDGDRGPQLVRRVADELELAGGGAAQLRDGRLVATRVPDHGAEHRGHQRHLGELFGRQAVVDHRRGHRGAGAQADRRQDREGRAHRPQPEPVEQREADPDLVERDRRPRGDQDDRDRVRERERGPQQLRPAAPTD